MTTWLREFTRFLIGNPKHPIYNREQVGWSYIGVWRRIRRGCIPLILILLFVTSAFCGGSCGLTTLPSTSSSDVLPLLLVAASVGILASETLLHFITGLIATTLAATVISAELEAQTFALLRLTPIPVREIVMAKYGAVLRQIRTPILANMLLRAFIVLTAVAVIVGLIAISIYSSTSLASELDIPLPSMAALIGAYGFAVGSVVVAALTWAVYYIIRPLLDMMLFAAIGVFASSFAKTRSGGLVTAGVFRLLMVGVSYVASQFFSTTLTLASMPLMALPGIPQWIEQSQIAPGILVIAGSGLAIVILIGAVAVQLAVIIALLSFASSRANNLPSLG